MVTAQIKSSSDRALGALSCGGTNCKIVAFANRLGIGLCVLVGACSSGTGTSSKPAIEPAPHVAADVQAQARAFYDTRCATCHGPRGHADGASAPTLRPRPQQLSDRIWQSNVTNARIERVLLHGGPAVGRSAVMPGFHELSDQPLLRAGLVALVRSFATP